MSRTLPVPPYVQAVLDPLWAAGYEAYPVGGCVRDSLLDRTPEDWDLCTAALPEQVLEVFGQTRTIPTGIRHGTVTVLSQNKCVEVTTFRTDGVYLGHRKPAAVTFIPSLSEDLARRDFTVNALALARDGTVLDYFGGLRDLDAGLIRCVGEPERRFTEDALRILRALRFAARYGFQVEAETDHSLRRLRGLVKSLSAQRVFHELTGILCGADCGRVLLSYPAVILQVLPELAGLADWAETVRAVAAAPPALPPRLALLLRSLGRDGAYQALVRLKADGETRDTVALLAGRAQTAPPETRLESLRLLADLGPEKTLWLADLWLALLDPRGVDFAAQVRTLLDQNVCLSAKGLAVNGRDLLTLGIPPGKPVGQALQRLLEAVWAGTPNRRESLLALAARWR